MAVVKPFNMWKKWKCIELLLACLNGVIVNWCICFNLHSSQDYIIMYN